MTAAHSPAPWTCTVSARGDDLRVSCPTHTIIGGCGCCGSPYMNDATAQADATLIAFAPNMLAELERLAESFDWPDDHPTSILIRQVKGETA